MPYLRDDIKRELSGDMAVRGPQTSGELTYVIQQQLQSYLLARGEALCFADLANCLGALEAAKADFTEAILLNYEHKKRHQNGCVWAPELITKVLS